MSFIVGALRLAGVVTAKTCLWLLCLCN